MRLLNYFADVRFYRQCNKDSNTDKINLTETRSLVEEDSSDTENARNLTKQRS